LILATTAAERLVGFSVKAGLSSTITLYELDTAGQRPGQHSHTIPGFAFLHDFALTPNYAIFFQNPVSFGPLPFLLGFKGAAECISYNPKQPTKLLIIPRNGDPMQVIDDRPLLCVPPRQCLRARRPDCDRFGLLRHFPSLEGARLSRPSTLTKCPPASCGALRSIWPLAAPRSRS
jgi:all-trans-8'-apo-beta-carotenal 15,15'-oxygenase